MNRTKKIAFGTVIGIAVGFALKSIPIGIGVGLVFGMVPLKSKEKNKRYD